LGKRDEEVLPHHIEDKDYAQEHPYDHESYDVDVYGYDPFFA
jgi:hypothetical protein